MDGPIQEQKGDDMGTREEKKKKWLSVVREDHDITPTLD